MRSQIRNIIVIVCIFRLNLPNALEHAVFVETCVLCAFNQKIDIDLREMKEVV